MEFRYFHIEKGTFHFLSKIADLNANDSLRVFRMFSWAGDALRVIRAVTSFGLPPAPVLDDSRFEE